MQAKTLSELQRRVDEGHTVACEVNDGGECNCGFIAALDQMSSAREVPPHEYYDEDSHSL